MVLLHLLRQCIGQSVSLSYKRNSSTEVFNLDTHTHKNQKLLKNIIKELIKLSSISF